MKTKYNNIIEWIIMIILAAPCSALLALKYMLKVVAKLVEALQVVVECSITWIRKLCKELVKALRVKD